MAAGFGPDDHVVVTVGTLHAGTRGNVVPEQASLEVTVRAPGQAALDRATEVVRRAARAESTAHGCPRSPDVTTLSASPATLCDPGTVAEVRRAHVMSFGAGRVTAWPPSSATEDFALYGDAGLALHGVAGIRTGYWMLGVGRTPAVGAGSRRHGRRQARRAPGRTTPRTSVPTPG